MFKSAICLKYCLHCVSMNNRSPFGQKIKNKPQYIKAKSYKQNKEKINLK